MNHPNIVTIVKISGIGEPQLSDIPDKINKKFSRALKTDKDVFTEVFAYSDILVEEWGKAHGLDEQGIHQLKVFFTSHTTFN